MIGRRRYLPRNAQLERQGYRPLPRMQDLHPIHEAGGYTSPACPRCHPADQAGPESQHGGPTHGEPRD